MIAPMTPYYDEDDFSAEEFAEFAKQLEACAAAAKKAANAMSSITAWLIINHTKRISDDLF